MTHKSTENPGNQPNIFTTMRQKRAANASEATRKEVEYAANFESDKTSADNVKKLVVFLLVLVTGIVVFLATQYYTDVFTNTVGAEAALVLAIALAAAVELGKIKLLLEVARAIVFGWWQKSFYTVGYWAIVALLAIGCFWWSVNVSTKGLKEYAEAQTEVLVSKDTLAALLSASTSSIDSLIAAETASRKVAESSRWRGQQTVYGLRNARENNNNIAQLQVQRSEIVKQVTADYKEGLKHREKRTSALTMFIMRVGGYMELASFLCVFAMAFFDRRLWEVMREQTPPYPTDPGTRKNTDTNGANDQNTAYQNALRANLGGAAVQNQANSAVSQQNNCVTSDTPVSQKNTGNTESNADSVLKSARTELLRDLANLRNNNGAPGTIATRMHGVFNRVGRAAWQSGFDPSYKVASDYYNVADEAMTALRNVGHSYEYSRAHLDQITVTINAAAA